MAKLTQKPHHHPRFHHQCGRVWAPAHPGSQAPLWPSLNASLKGFAGLPSGAVIWCLPFICSSHLQQPAKVVGSLIMQRQTAAGAAGRRSGCGRRASSPRAASVSWLTRETLSALGDAGRCSEPSPCRLGTASQPIPWLCRHRDLGWRCPRPLHPPPPPRWCMVAQPRSPPSHPSCAVGCDGSPALGARGWRAHTCAPLGALGARSTHVLGACTHSLGATALPVPGCTGQLELR